MGQGCTKHFNLLASVSHAASPFNGKGNNVTDENQQPAKTFIFDETLNSPFIQEILARLTDCEVQMLLVSSFMNSIQSIVPIVSV